MGIKDDFNNIDNVMSHKRRRVDSDGKHINFLYHQKEGWVQNISRRSGKGSQDFFATLTDEIALHVLSYLSEWDLCKFQLVSQWCNRLCNDSQVWRLKYLQRFVFLDRVAFNMHTKTPNSKSMPPPHSNWKRMYQIRHNWSIGKCRVIRQTESQNKPSKSEMIKYPLAQYYGHTIILVDLEHGIRVWKCIKLHGKELPSPDFILPLPIDEFGSPVCLTVDSSRNKSSGVIPFLIAFDSGNISTYNINWKETQVISSLHTYAISGAPIVMAYCHPFLATLSCTNCFEAFKISDSAKLTKRAILRSSTVNLPCTLNIREVGNKDSGSVLVSIVHTVSLFTSGLSIGIQEIDIGDTPHIPTRVYTCIPLSRGDTSFARSQHVGPTSLTPPTFISYNHPYLLTSHQDNSLTLYLVKSTRDVLKIGQPRRLWGHTSGVVRAQVASRGKAISVSLWGNEIRVWELEGVAAGKSIILPGLVESVKVQGRNGEDSGNTNEMDGNAKPVGYVGMDDEKVCVIRDYITLYDFT